MKRNNLTTAVLAGITGVAGIASVSNAVNLNADGVGQVLIYPYYTVRNGLNTLISVVNTTNEVKAVKVRFLEGKNSRECLDFNLYMSPYDVWTSALIPVSSTVPGYTDQPSVKLITTDSSCVVPTNITSDGQEFLPYAFTGAFSDGVGSSLERCTEGHFEVIEMGTVIGSDAAAATHPAGGSPACGTLQGNWTAPTGKWIADASTNIVDPDGTGGLFGSASLVDVAEGVDAAYNADAFQSYSLAQQHANPGDLFPSLATGSEMQSIIFDRGAAVSTDWLTSSVQAVSASYMHSNLYGEYALDAGINAKTEWVVTFPTKSFYVDPIRAIGAGAPVEPFTTTTTANGACEPYLVQGLFDREENAPTDPPGSVVPSPVPPGIDPTIPVFCWEANVLEFSQDALTGDSQILGSNNTTHLQTPYVNGWLNLAFSQATTDNAQGATYTGLPVTGFAVQKYTNTAAQPGLLAQYAGLFPHRGLKTITS